MKRMRYITATAADVLAKITEALGAGRMVYVTDGTVSRLVKSAELDGMSLFIRTEKNGWIDLEVSRVFGRLNGWEIGTVVDAAVDFEGALIIAPAWFFE